MNPIRVDFIVDLAYGLMIFVSIALILTAGTGVGVAFGLGVLVSYVIHIAWKMARFDPDWMTSEVAERVEKTVGETVSKEVEKVEKTVGETVSKEVEKTVSDTVSKEVEKTVGDTVSKEVERTVGDTVSKEFEKTVGVDGDGVVAGEESTSDTPERDPETDAGEGTN
jgi:preprotein translocase subunit SecF